MIVVSNTSPLTNLAAIGHFELLRKHFGEIAEIRSSLDALRRQAGFFLRESLYRQTLREAGEEV